MSQQPTYFEYKGQRVMLSVLSGMVDIPLVTLWRWAQCGKLTEARIRYHQRRAAELTRARELSAKSGVPWVLVIRRRARGWDNERAATAAPKAVANG